MLDRFTKFRFLSILSIAVGLSACEGLNEVRVTYTEATAVYGDLDALRSTPLIGPARSIQNAGKIFMNEDLLLIGEETEGIHVYDNSNPESPTPLLFLNIPGNREFFISGQFLYAESIYDMIQVDLSDYQNPSITSRERFAFGEELTNGNGQTIIDFEFETVTREIDKSDNIYNYLNNNHNIAYLDFADRLIPPSAVPASFSGSSGGQIGSINKIAASNGYVYTVSRTQLSVFSTEPFEQVFRDYVGFNLETIYPFGDRLFVGTTNSVEIFNVTNPELPAFESSFWHATSCDPVLPVSERTAFATLRTGDFAECPGDINALVVLDVPVEGWNVSQVQEIPMESPYGLTLINDRLYVGEGEHGLKVFDASNERALRLISSDASVKAYDVLPHPTVENLLLIAGPDGLIQYRLNGSDFSPISTIAF